MIKEICFVCTGNTCRSPVGEYAARAEVSKRGLDYTISSAGTDASVGCAASENSCIACSELSLDLTPHRARQLDSSFVRDDIVFAVMTDNHRVWLNRVLGVPDDMIYTLSGGIPDPFMRPLSVYRQCVGAITDAVPALLDKIAADDENRVAVRPATMEDAQFMRDLEAECLGTDPSVESVEQEIAFEHARLLIAERAGERLGFISSQVTADTVFISNLCTLPEHRRTGAASHLLFALRAIALAQGCCEMSLEVRVSNKAAIALYSKYGFCRIGTRPRFYSDPTEDADIMTARLI